MDESLSSTSGSTASRGGVDGAPVNDIDLVALGADPTGQQDSTASVQAAFNLAATGDGTGTIVFPPNSTVLCLGQIVVRAGTATSTEARGSNPDQGSE